MYRCDGSTWVDMGGTVHSSPDSEGIHQRVAGLGWRGRAGDTVGVNSSTGAELMEWELVKPWVNRIGILLEFLSFWFAAPEIVTEIRQDEGHWLRMLEQKVEAGAGCLLELGLAIAWYPAMFVVLLLTGERVTRRVVKKVGYGGLNAALGWASFFLCAGATILVLVVLSTVAWAVGKPWWVWGMVGVGVVLMTMLLLVVFALVGSSLLETLSDDKHIRQRSLVAGIVIFVLGFLLQLIATF